VRNVAIVQRGAEFSTWGRGRQRGEKGTLYVTSSAIHGGEETLPHWLAPLLGEKRKQRALFVCL